MEYLELIQSAFPNCQVDDLQGYGANIHTSKTIITIYYGRKKKYCLFGIWNKWERLDALLDYLTETINPPKKVAPIEPQPIQTGNKVQQAIDHISRKRDFINANQPDNKLATFCLTLISELQQYL